MGGYGSTVVELFADKRIATPVVRIGWPDVFIEHASTVDYLRQKHGLTVEKAVEGVKNTLAAETTMENSLRIA
jgi:1-deoxy-D-xylulose-5-phosphate synthase